MLNVECRITYSLPTHYSLLVSLSLIIKPKYNHYKIYQERKTVCYNDGKIFFEESINYPESQPH